MPALYAAILKLLGAGHTSGGRGSCADPAREAVSLEKLVVPLVRGVCGGLRKERWPEGTLALGMETGNREWLYRWE